MNTPRQPDMAKVRVAVAAIELRRLIRTPATLAQPKAPKPPVVAQDAALRKPLRAHGSPCCGFHCSHFLNSND